MAFWVLLLDAFGIATAVLAAWLWYAASRRRLRRISRFEALDSADRTASSRRSIGTAFSTAARRSRQPFLPAASHCVLPPTFWQTSDQPPDSGRRGLLAHQSGQVEPMESPPRKALGHGTAPDGSAPS
jgi:hypothetical protein